MERTYRTRSRKLLLMKSIRTWQAAMNRLETGEGSLDHDAFNAERLEIAGGARLFLGDGHYVECRPFREVSIRDVEAVDLEVPAFLTDCSR